ncbi:MAG: hypothetical protein AMXMBFR33_51130 [Candidatus Xenobia bacterium]
MLATIQEACVLNGAQPHGYESTFGEVSSYIARLSGSPIYSESYVRDNLGRITQRTEVLQGVTTVWGYGYDLSGRLVTVTRNGAAFESYTYDQNDNRLTKTTAAGTTTYAHDDQDRLLSAVGPEGAESWVYDGHGDLLSHNGSAGQTSFDYETGGQLLSLTRPDDDVVNYEMDAGNKRAVKRVNGVVQRQWVYAGGLLPVAELDGSGNLVAVFNGGFMVKNGTTYRLLRDHLGSVRMVVDAGTGTVVQRLSYGPWGEVLEDTNPGFQPFGYAGGLYDPDTGLVRFGARDYEPGVGRWTCTDPVGFEGGASNLYAYCSQDPINAADPFGENPIAFGAAAYVAAEVGLTAWDVYGTYQLWRDPNATNAARVAATGLTGLGAIGPGGGAAGLLRHIDELKLTYFQTWLTKGDRLTEVYVGLKNDCITYVGITKNFARRQGQHAKRFVIRRLADVVGAPHKLLTRNEARAVEQYLINQLGPGIGGALKNKINSINSNSMHLQRALNMAMDFELF